MSRCAWFQTIFVWHTNQKRKRLANSCTHTWHLLTLPPRLFDMVLLWLHCVDYLKSVTPGCHGNCFTLQGLRKKTEFRFRTTHSLDSDRTTSTAPKANETWQKDPLTQTLDGYYVLEIDTECNYVSLSAKSFWWVVEFQCFWSWAYSYESSGKVQFKSWTDLILVTNSFGARFRLRFITHPLYLCNT